MKEQHISSNHAYQIIIGLSFLYLSSYDIQNTLIFSLFNYIFYWILFDFTNVIDNLTRDIDLMFLCHFFSIMLSFILIHIHITCNLTYSNPIAYINWIIILFVPFLCQMAFVPVLYCEILFVLLPITTIIIGMVYVDVASGILILALFLYLTRDIGK